MFAHNPTCTPRLPKTFYPQVGNCSGGGSVLNLGECIYSFINVIDRDYLHITCRCFPTIVFETSGSVLRIS